MAVEIKFTGAGESITQATVLKWLKPDGSAVKAGDAVVELETDKASKEEFATSAGVLSIKVQPGTRVDAGVVLGLIDPNGKATAAPEAKAAPTATAAATATAEVRLSPAARVMAETQGIDASKVAPSAKGVVTKGDLLAQAQTPTAPAIPVAKPVARTGERETRVRMTPLRARIAERLLSAQQNAAILTTFNEADMTRVMEARARYKEAFQKKHGVGLGFMSFFVKACIEGMKAFPSVNARIDGDEVVYQNYYNFSLAVSTDRGLMVPVLRDCDQLTFAEIEKGIVALAAKARDGKIAVADPQGGTFTITNGGIFGSMMSTPILNPPQSAILGMHAIQKRAVVVEDQIVIRPMMYLALSYDHRLIDGREAVSFLVRVKECLENPERMLFEV